MFLLLRLVSSEIKTWFNFNTVLKFSLRQEPLQTVPKVILSHLHTHGKS